MKLVTSLAASLLMTGGLSTAYAAESAGENPARETLGTMRAAVVTDGKVKIESVPIPVPRDGEVRIRVRAASVNPVDWKIADRNPRLPYVAGRDMAGVIDAVGEGVEDWKAGDEVIAISASGSYAEYATARTEAIARKPARMSFEEAAGIPIVGETAWRALVTGADVKPGQRVLIHGAAGGVGSSAVQIARSRGAHVIATASQRNHEFLRSIGADETIDYNTTRFEDVVRNADVVLNTVNAETGQRSLATLKRGGVLVSVVGPTSEDLCRAAQVRCVETGLVNGNLLGELAQLANEGKFRVHVDEVLSLDEVAKAWDMNRGRHTRGKLVLTLAPASTQSSK
jgi:NADPH:quinone reductase-like Zn-dependent oxidoreductase